MKLEDIKPGGFILGVLPGKSVQVINVKYFGQDALELTYKSSEGQIGNTLLYRDDENRLELMQAGRPWAFDGNGADFRLVAEAHRIQLAHLFDPVLAVHSSNVDPLPHQITAVYESMLPRQPLRFLLADDPGAGKTIMAGLLIKELIARGDLKRCLIVCPGSLATQWQDELSTRFDIRFEILTNEGIESAVTGNWFMENDLAIARLDKLARNEDIQQKLSAESNYYDLVIFDEAHKLSATYFGGEVKYTKRFRMAQRISEQARHFLLMTATPHNGKEEDFQLFLSLLDGDRFEGKPREGVHQVDASDLMRRMVKENLLKFDGTPLFPERIAYTASYELSPLEAKLYAEVTEYVRDEFNRADALQNDKRAGTVGFALTILQRRLASSPEAIYQSLSRRRQRLTEKMKEAELVKRGLLVPAKHEPVLDTDDLDDLEDAPENEVEQTEEKVLDQATAAQTIEELKKEIDRLQQLENLAAEIRRSGQDTKWAELSSLFHTVLSPASQATEERKSEDPHHIPAPKPSPKQKLVVFTEQRDTLNYLQQRIGDLLGTPKAVMVIHGAMGREERAKSQESFLYDPDVRVLLATDAAGEGINLQRAHLMVNYDLPWNPNRLEQRFGRIHRIGQTEVCHLWNLVAKNTREGEVYKRLLDKLEEARKALGGQVFDVLGKLQFDGKPLRELLLEAIRYGDLPETRAKLTQRVEAGVDTRRITDMMNDHALVRDSMDTSKLDGIRKNMELAEAQKLQPFYVRQFFMEAFSKLGGSIHEREDERYEIKHVPASVRNRDRLIGRTQPVLEKYERVVFEKKLINPEGKVRAAFLTPGHAMLQSVIDITLERHSDLLRQGTILVDENDYTENPRVLFFIQHSIKDASLLANGDTRTISQRMLYVEMDAEDQVLALRYAPYLDYRPLLSDEPSVDELLSRPEFSFIQHDMEQHALGYAIRSMVPNHLTEVRDRKIEWVNKTRAAVKERLTHEITYWDHRANELRLKEQAGKSPGTLNSTEARRRADELSGRLRKRLEELDREAQISAVPPVILGGVVVVPLGLIYKIQGKSSDQIQHIRNTQLSAARARKVIMDIERSFGCEPVDVETLKKGYDIESYDPQTGHYRLIEVKGRVIGADVITITKNEILTGLNSPDHFILAMVEFLDDTNHNVHYLRQPFSDAGLTRDFNGTSVNLPFKDLLQKKHNTHTMIRKKLIEVALPLEAINEASAREKSIRHGHPSTLHLWWARRPLAAARAVIFAQMVDDPGSWPELFPTEKKQQKERERLFRIIEDLVKWENTNNENVLNAAREEIWQSWRRACAENADHPQAKELFDRSKLPAFHDPFAGGGALPLEAQRLGLESYASDLNPVAVLINKAMIEIPPKFAGKPPVNPDARTKKDLFEKEWKGAQGLAEDVRYYGQWMRDEAEKRIGHLYPKVKVTSEMVKERPDLKPYQDEELTVIAWIWARTVKSPNPAFADVDVPLASTFILSSKPGKEAYVEPIIGKKEYHFEVKTGKPQNFDDVNSGTKLARGANFSCIMSSAPLSGDYIKAEGKAGRMGAKLMAIVAEGKRGRIYLSPNLDQENIAKTVTPNWKPDVTISGSTQYIGVKPYGMEKLDQLFSNRQLLALSTFSDLIIESKDLIKSHAIQSGLPEDTTLLVNGASGATAYAEAVGIYLAFALSKQADLTNTLCRWEPVAQCPRNLFGRQAIPMIWDFAESNPLGESSGSWSVFIDGIYKAFKKGFENVTSTSIGFSEQSDASIQTISSGKIISTDPPYYDNVPYSDLADFFYVWLRKSIRESFHDLFATISAPKSEELVAFAYRHENGKVGAEEFFLTGMTKAMQKIYSNSHPLFPVTIYYAFKQSETTTEKGTTSTGWETFLDAVISAGFSISGTWPMNTENSSRLRGQTSNALATSIVLVCNKFEKSKSKIARRDFISMLKTELPIALRYLQTSNIAPVDLAQASIGPGMAIYTRYIQVLDSEGKALSVREALSLINQVLDETLAEQEGDFDADTRFALTWFEQQGFEEGEFGVADVLARAKGTSVQGMVEAGVLHSGRGKVRLLKAAELPANWNPEKDDRLTVWECVHHLIKQLEAGGETAAADLVNQLASKADTARELAYRLYSICERKKRAQDAMAYNALVQSWPEIQRIAQEPRRNETVQTDLFNGQ